MGRSLSDLELEKRYRSDKHHLVRDFYVPCMKRTVLYERAVGYFTSHGLCEAAKGIAHLVSNGGRMELVASPRLTDEDIAAMEAGYASKEDTLVRAAHRSLGQVHSALVRDRLAALEWLIREGALKVSLALPLDASQNIRPGLYHEKFGIFHDRDGHLVAFTGSSNETQGGLIDNFESTHVFRSWDDPHERTTMLATDFKELRRFETAGLEVIPFTEATAEILAPYRVTTAPTEDPDEHEAASTSSLGSGKLARPLDIHLRPHQQEAVDNWIRARGTGVFNMATGAGKTIAAMAVIEWLCAQASQNPVLVIVVVPFLNLADQWGKEFIRWGHRPVLCARGRNRWLSAAQGLIHLLNRKQSSFGCLLTSNATFSSPPFQELLEEIQSQKLHMLLLGDEVHNLGAKKLRKALPEQAQYRLGLSATPERWCDPDGTAAIQDYFGEQVAEFTLADALKAKPPVLCPYDYYPVVVELEEDEVESYIELSTKIAQLLAISGTRARDENDPLLHLLIKRSRLLASARQKIPTLVQLMARHQDQSHTLIYCGDGRAELEAVPKNDTMDQAGEPLEMRQVEAAAAALRQSFEMEVSTYTAATSATDRKSRLTRFENGELQALVAIKCLDEGVDIPMIRRAFILASSTNPRQFIQRRGRILRRASGKDYAELYDFVVAPPNFERLGVTDQAERLALKRMVKREMIRVLEFASTARNHYQARESLSELLARLDLAHL